MLVVQFSSARVVEFVDPRAFERRARNFLLTREAENSYILGLVPNLLTHGPQPGVRLFTVEEGEAVVAAGIISNGFFCGSWATQEMVTAIADHAAKGQWRIHTVYAPGHTSHLFSKAFAERTNMRVGIGRSERVYQLTELAFTPQGGHLEVATAADKPFLQRWLQGFVTEADYETDARDIAQLVDALVDPRRLYLWKAPHPVSMAAWVAPTPNGASINFVFTPPEHRGHGYGKSVTAALGAQMLAGGLRYCFIMTDNEDHRSNHMYQSIGARTLCELLKCTFHPVEVPAAKTAGRSTGLCFT